MSGVKRVALRVTSLKYSRSLNNFPASFSASGIIANVVLLNSPSFTIKNGLAMFLSRNNLSKKSSFILKSLLTAVNLMMVEGAETSKLCCDSVYS
ncbi:hypothetical protein D3C81_1455240 [compost metagenome]